MKTLDDFVKWIARQNVINLDDVQINKLTRWLINNKQYQEVQQELIEMMKQVEKK